MNTNFRENEILLSIVVPVYNVESYIRKNIDSIISLGRNDFELLLVNDGSTDNSFEIIQQYATDYPFIKCFTQTNGGQGKARNRGLENAQGEWILFEDADDFMLTEGLSKLLNKLGNLNDKVDMVLYNTFSYYESTNSFENFTSWQYDISDNGMSGSEFILQVLRRNPSYGYCAWFYAVRRSLLSINDLKFDSTGTSNDIDFTFKIWNIAKEVYYFDIDVYAYRREQPNSITHSPSEQWMKNVLKRVENNLDYMDTIFLSRELKNYYIMSFFHLYLVVLSILTQYNYTDKVELMELMRKINSRLLVNTPVFLFKVPIKFFIAYIFNRILPLNIFLNLWKLKSL